MWVHEQWANFCSFFKKNLSTVSWYKCIRLFSSYQILSSLTKPASYLRAGKSFVTRENLEFSIYTPWSEGRRQSSNLISLWSFFHLWSCHVIDTLWSTKILLFLSASRLPNWKFDGDNFLEIFGGAKQNLSALCTWDLLWWDEIADY